MSKPPAKLRSVRVSLPLGLGSAEWQADPTEQRAAWALYVELITRVSSAPLDLERGLIREALNSLHSLFPTTRQILREAGPGVGIVATDSVGGLAIAVLNRGIRPFLAKWHPLLSDWEERRAEGTSQRDHERAWPEEATLRGELEKLRLELNVYAMALAKSAGAEG